MAHEIGFTRLAGALGAEVTGIDLRQPIDEATFAVLEAGLLEHQVLFFREQRIEHAHHRALARRFGEPVAHPAYPHVEGFPEINVLESTAENPTKIDTWHTDMTFLEKIVKGYVDDSGQFHITKRIIQPKSPDIKLPPELQSASGYTGEPASSSKSKGGAPPHPKAKGPIVHRKGTGDQPTLSTTTTDDEADQALRDMGITDSYVREWSRAMSEAYDRHAEHEPHWSDDH